MPKPIPHPDVLVLGDHPCTYLAAALLMSKPGVRAVHSTIPNEPFRDRLVLINPEFFALHKMLEPLEQTLKMTAVQGIRFLSDTADTASEHRGKATLAYVAEYSELRDALRAVAVEQGVQMSNGKAFDLLHVDEAGVEIRLQTGTVKPKAVVLGGPVDDRTVRMLGLPETWDREVVHRFTYALLQGPEWTQKPVLPMSLDVNGSLSWGWLLSHGQRAQVAIAQPIASVAKQEPRQLLQHWVGVLKKHQAIPASVTVTDAQIVSVDLPLGGALVQEGVANRTLLIGPAGGFFSACGEDIYPNSWSAVFAVDVLRKALKEKHLQDALNNYRMVWRTTLGDYLRGPQQNLRFLLPLVYRNQVMTTRLTESILQGKSVVR
jgi:flavin-dependent dehydrogenase